MAVNLLQELESKRLQLAEYQQRLVRLQSQQVKELAVANAVLSRVESAPTPAGVSTKLLERDTEIACLENLVSLLKTQLHELTNELTVYEQESYAAQKRIEQAVIYYNDCREEMLLAWHQLRDAIASDPLERSAIIAESDIQLPLGSASIDPQGRVLLREPFSTNDEVLAHFMDWTSPYFLSGDEILDSILGSGENESHPQGLGGNH